MLGLSVFWSGYRFSSPSIAFFTLYCIACGDEISNTFNEVIQIDYIFGAIFLFTFVFFSMQVMMNIFLIIIGDAYSAAKDSHKYQWLEDEELKQPDLNEKDDKHDCTDSESDDSLNLSPRKRSKNFRTYR